MEDQGLDMHTLARRCGVTYQTVKNVIDGESVGRRFISQLISQFGIEKNPMLLRRVLIAFLRVQFDEESERLLKAAGLLSDPD
jgi:hypothetical protein